MIISLVFNSVKESSNSLFWCIFLPPEKPCCYTSNEHGTLAMINHQWHWTSQCCRSGIAWLQVKQSKGQLDKSAKTTNIDPWKLISFPVEPCNKTEKRNQAMQVCVCVSWWMQKASVHCLHCPFILHLWIWKHFSTLMRCKHSTCFVL